MFKKSELGDTGLFLFLGQGWGSNLRFSTLVLFLFGNWFSVVFTLLLTLVCGLGVTVVTGMPGCNFSVSITG